MESYFSYYNHFHVSMTTRFLKISQNGIFSYFHSLTPGNSSQCVPSCEEIYYSTKSSQGTLHAPSLLNKIRNDNLEKRFRTANWVSLRADPKRFSRFVKKANALSIAMNDFYGMMQFISSHRQYGVSRLVEISLKSLTKHVNKDFSFLREQYGSLKADYTISYEAIRDTLKNNIIQLRSLSVNSYRFRNFESEHKVWADRTGSAIRKIINNFEYIKDYEKYAMRNLSLKFRGINNIKKIPISCFSKQTGFECKKDLNKLIFKIKKLHTNFTTSISGSESDKENIIWRLQMVLVDGDDVLKCLKECRHHIHSMHSYLDESMKNILFNETQVKKDSVNEILAEFKKHVEKWEDILCIVNENRNPNEVFNFIKQLLTEQKENNTQKSTKDHLKYSFDFINLEIMYILDSAVKHIVSQIVNQFSGFFQKLASLEAYYNETDLKISHNVKNLSIWRHPTVNSIGEFKFKLSKHEAQNPIPMGTSFGRLVEENTLTRSLEQILGTFNADLMYVIKMYRSKLKYHKIQVKLAAEDLRLMVIDKIEEDKIGRQFIR